MVSKDIEKFLINKAWRIRRTGEFIDLDSVDFLEEISGTKSPIYNVTNMLHMEQISYNIKNS